MTTRNLDTADACLRNTKDLARRIGEHRHSNGGQYRIPAMRAELRAQLHMALWHVGRAAD